MVQVFVELSCVASSQEEEEEEEEEPLARAKRHFERVTSILIQYQVLLFIFLPQLPLPCAPITATHLPQTLNTQAPQLTLRRRGVALHPLRPHRTHLLSSCTRAESRRSLSCKTGGCRQRKLVASQVRIEVPLEIPGHE